MKAKHFVFPSLLLVLGGGAFFGWHKYGPDGQLEALCRKEIVENLRSPASAMIVEVRRDGLLWEGTRRVRLVIDSDNAFGASLRTYFVCKQSELAASAGKANFRVVERKSWLSLDRKKTEAEAKQQCLALVKKEFSSNQTLPPPQWTGVLTDLEGDVRMGVLLQSPEWGSGNLVCTFESGGRVSVAHGKLPS